MKIRYALGITGLVITLAIVILGPKKSQGKDPIKKGENSKELFNEADHY